MAGYSGTPLEKKLGLRPGLRGYWRGAPPEVEALFGSLSRARILRGPLDYLHVFETDRDALVALIPRLAVALSDQGQLWISWPKKASGQPTTLDEKIVRELGLATGLVDVKVCAVDEIWSGLKFVRRLHDRAAGKKASRGA